MPFDFDPARRLHVSVDEAVWTVNPESGVLVSGARKVFKGSAFVRTGVRPALPAQQLIVTTPLCATMGKLGAALAKNDRTLHALCRRHEFAIGREPIPSKPFAIDLLNVGTFKKMAEALGARRRHAYNAGLAICVGVGSEAEAIRAMAALRLHLPGFVALAANSPGIVKGAACFSRRYLAFHELIAWATPPVMTSWEQYALVARIGNFDANHRLCDWALRFREPGMIELRACDTQNDTLQGRLRTLALAALMRLLVREALSDTAEPAPFVSDLTIETGTMAAAYGRFDLPAYSERLTAIAKRPGHHEELTYLKRLLT